MTMKWAAVAAVGTLLLAGCSTNNAPSGNQAVCKDFESAYNDFAAGKLAAKDLADRIKSEAPGASGKVAVILGGGKVTPADVAQACSDAGDPIVLTHTS